MLATATRDATRRLAIVLIAAAASACGGSVEVSEPREALARRFSLDGRRSAVDVESEPERAMRLAVDWAFDTDRTDAELAHLLRSLANWTSEPIWLRLCDFRS